MSAQRNQVGLTVGNRVSSCCSNVGARARKMDSFAEGFQMKFDHGETHYGSLGGFACTLFLIVSLLGFAYTKMQTLLQRKDTDIIEAFQESYFPDHERFTAAEDDFFVAAALTNYDSNTEIIEKPEYGELLIEHYGWGNADDGYSYGSHALNNHYCTDEDLGFERTDQTVIYPIFERSIPEVQTYKKKFKCINKESLTIWGDYNSAKAMQLSVKFHMCSGHSYCKSKDEIREWISGLYIVLLYNQIRFQSESYFDESMVREARLLYIPVSSQTRQLIPFRVSVAELKLQDQMSIELGDVTLHEESGLFKLDPLSLLPYEKKDDVWVSVTLERGLGLTEYSRTTYTGFDFISDVGGLQGFLVGAFFVFVSAWNFNSFDNTMVSRLFREKAPDHPDDSKSENSQSQPIVLSTSPNCRDFFKTLFPEKCCCKNRRYERVLAKAREKLDKEIDICNIIRLHRFLYTAVVDIVPEARQKAIWQQTRYFIVNDDPDEPKPQQPQQPSRPPSPSSKAPAPPKMQSGPQQREPRSFRSELEFEKVPPNQTKVYCSIQKLREESKKQRSQRSERLFDTDQGGLDSQEMRVEEINEVTKHKSVVKRRYTRFGVPPEATKSSQPKRSNYHQQSRSQQDPQQTRQYEQQQQQSQERTHLDASVQSLEAWFKENSEQKQQRRVFRNMQSSRYI